MKILITGGAGFIGSAVARHAISGTNHSVVNLDKLTYAGNLSSLTAVSDSNRYTFVQGDICERSLLDDVFSQFRPDAVMHLAAESHVDRSINSPGAFIQTNIMGTYTLLEATREYWSSLNTKGRESFRFHHISTDEVYGDLEGATQLFTEKTPYAPSSPYSASKASSDHLVRAWGRTFNLPILITNCSNNYGPFHFPEKLIPLVIINALNEKPLPIYGDGQQVRDWLYVEDHARALLTVLERGVVGETYNIGGHNERSNLDVVRSICVILDQLSPRQSGTGLSYDDLIVFVPDRPGHDLRYAIDASKLERELGWVPEETFDSGLRKTVEWFLGNRAWWQALLVDKQIGNRLGL